MNSFGLDPKNKSSYETNSAQFIKKLEALDQAIKDAIQTIPPGQRRLLTYHDSWPYFARRYGFQVIGAVQPSDFADPSPREVIRLIEQIRKEKVPAVFGSEVFPSPVLEQIAREAKSRYIDKLRDDELPGKPGDPQHSYIGMMVENMTIMFEALGGSADALKKVDPAPVAGSHADYRRIEIVNYMVNPHDHRPGDPHSLHPPGVEERSCTRLAGVPLVELANVSNGYGATP